MKSASASSLPFPGGPVTYTYAVTNTGNVPLSNVTLTDDKCSTVAFLGGDTNADNKLDLTETWSYSCTMSISTTTTNIATATGHFGDITVQDTDTKTVEVGLLSTLVIQKSVTGNSGGTDPDLHVPAAKIGDTLTYHLHYTGSGPLTAVVITDVLPQGLEFAAGSALGNADFGNGSYDSTTRTITWNASAEGGALPNPADGTLTYQVKVLNTAPEFAQPLVNTATIDSAETAPDSGTASVAVLPPPLALTPPPTDTFTPETGSSNPGFTLMLILLGVAGLAIGIGFVTPTPERVRRRDRLG
ncbi:MAG TPA: isopeptide-forming domain-containing fimbrial protein [Candidatus Bathyarchaeia archaeon]|nr:isopeptide-forming domain-containing fimbrial protein [Candidatus Bathyarchaeia archaeon]